ncbi:MAG: efflux RND transporter periplasmic adaptor subunit, partial [Bdellovibrionota bacterium]
MNKPMAWTIGGLVLVFSGIFGWYNLKQHFIKEFFAHFTPPPQAVSTAVAKRVTWQPYISAVGNIGATNGVDISPEVSGQIVHVYFGSGQFVKKGDALIQLDDKSEKAQLADIQAQLQLAKTNLARTKSLLEQKVSTQSAYDDATSKVKQLQANYENVISSISKKLIRAPFDGKIGISQIDYGQYIAAGQVCVSLQAINAYNVKFFLPQQDIKNIALNQVVKVY